MMGERTVMQESLFYGFSLEDHVPQDHLLRSIDRFVDLGGIRERLRPYYSETGRPSIDPELMIRMLIVGYSLGIRSERRLCEEVHLNLAYRWFCRLGLDGAVPDHSTFSKNRHVEGWGLYSERLGIEMGLYAIPGIGPVGAPPSLRLWVTPTSSDQAGSSLRGLGWAHRAGAKCQKLVEKGHSGGRRSSRR